MGGAISSTLSPGMKNLHFLHHSINHLISWHPSPGMNVLCIFLFILLVQHVLASKRKKHESSGGQHAALVPSGKRTRGKKLTGFELFEKEIGRGKVPPAVKIFTSADDGLKRRCAEHLISLGAAAIMELLDGTTRRYKFLLLRVLLPYATPETIDPIFNQLGKAEELFSTAASNGSMVCVPEKFLHVIEKVPKDHQEKIIAKVSSTLVKADKFEPLRALSEAFASKAPNLNVLLKIDIFISASGYEDKRARHVVALFDQPIINSRHYGAALRHSFGNWNRKRTIFTWLLLRANEEDLGDAISPEHADAVRGLGQGFQSVITKALGNAACEPRSRVMKRKKELEQTLDQVVFVPKDLIQIILQYFYYELKQVSPLQLPPAPSPTQ